MLAIKLLNPNITLSFVFLTFKLELEDLQFAKKIIIN